MAYPMPPAASPAAPVAPPLSPALRSSALLGGLSKPFALMHGSASLPLPGSASPGLGGAPSLGGGSQPSLSGASQWDSLLVGGGAGGSLNGLGLGCGGGSMGS